MDGIGGIRGACARCTLLHEIWQTSVQLNKMIHRFDPNFDDTQKRREEEPFVDPRQMSLIEE